MVFVLAAGLLAGFFMHSITAPATASTENAFAEKSIEEKRLEFISERDAIVAEMKEQGLYRCCLEKPCTYCIEKTPKHGEGAACTCADDVLSGRHPCGECIGEILEGHGDPNLAKYFARAIAEEVGEQHLGHLKEMIADKYNITVEEQAS
jgi:hypothetical protein